MDDSPFLGAGTWTDGLAITSSRKRGEGRKFEGQGLSKAELAELEKLRRRDVAPGWQWPRVNGASGSECRD